MPVNFRNGADVNNDEFVYKIAYPALDSWLVHLRSRRGSIFFADWGIKLLDAV